jgi:hypothetical protein
MTWFIRKLILSRYLSKDYQNSSLIDKIKEYEDKIRDKLKIIKLCPDIGRKHDLIHFKRSINNRCYHFYYITNDKEKYSFLQYCYYIGLHRSYNDIYKLLMEFENEYINFTDNNETIKFSAISTILLAFEHIERKKEVIQILLNNEFSITNGDKLLLNLYIFENIPNKIKMNIMEFLKVDLVTDIKMYIVDYRRNFNLLG